MSDRGHLIEIFSSYQGEGIYAGVRQIFIRLAGCHMQCVYCDTPESWTRQKNYQVEVLPESMRFETRANPVTVDDILDVVGRYRAVHSYHSISLSGGEPLLQVGFLKCLSEPLRRTGLPLYLETSGTLSEKLREAIDFVDMVALDIKLPSCPGVRMEWGDMEECLRVCRSKPAMVKIVVMEDSREDEVARAASAVRRIRPDLPVILQPATPVNTGTAPPTGRALERLMESCRREGIVPRVVPQIHVAKGWK